MLGPVDAFSKGMTLTMPIKPSQALLAALALVAAPAFAQEAASPEPAGQQPAQETQEAQDAPPAATDAPPADAAPANTAPADAAPADAPPADTPPTDTPPTDTPSTDGAPAGEAAAPDGAPAAQDAPAPAADAASAEPQIGQYYVKATNDDWTTRCIKTEQGSDPCELYQLLRDGEGNSVAEMTVIPLTNGEVAAGATVVAPLETDLIQGLGFGVGTAEPSGYPFNFCAPVGCVARLGFTEPEVSAMKRGSAATISLLPFGGDRENPVRLSVSLSGFTAAFDALAVYAAELTPAGESRPADAPPARPRPAEAPAN